MIFKAERLQIDNNIWLLSYKRKQGRNFLLQWMCEKSDNEADIDVIPYKWLMIGQYTFYNWTITMYTGLSLVICVV